MLYFAACFELLNVCFYLWGCELSCECVLLYLASIVKMILSCINNPCGLRRGGSMFLICPSDFHPAGHS